MKRIIANIAFTFAYLSIVGIVLFVLESIYSTRTGSLEEKLTIMQIITGGVIWYEVYYIFMILFWLVFKKTKGLNVTHSVLIIIFYDTMASSILSSSPIKETWQFIPYSIIIVCMSIISNNHAKEIIETYAKMQKDYKNKNAY